MRTREGVRITQSMEQARRARDEIDHEKRGRRRRGGREQGSLIGDRSQMREAVAAVGEHHREIAEHAAAVVTDGTKQGSQTMTFNARVSAVLSAT